MKRKAVYKRTTFWITVWCMAILTYIVVFTLSASFTTSLVSILGAVVLAYVGGDKIIDVRHGPEMQEPKQGEQ
jgi:tetrahydromethanopterin S-methyltransferase subunit E